MVIGEMGVVDGRGAGAGAPVAGDFDGAALIECGQDDLIGPVVMGGPTRCDPIVLPELSIGRVRR